MSHARLKTTGRGKWWWRAKIEGIGTEFVSGSAMEIRRPDVRGLDGFSASNYYSRADGTLEGSTSMVRAVMFRLDSTPGGFQYLFAKGPGTTDGWSFRVDSSRQLRWRVSNGTEVVSSALTLGETYVAVGTHDGANIELFVNGSSEGTGPLVSYTANADATEIGARNGGTSPFTSGTIIACAASDSVSTVGVASTYWESCKSLGDLATFSGIEHLWSAKRGNGSLTRDFVGSAPMTVNGSPSDTGLFAPFYDGEDGKQRLCVIKRGRDAVIDEQCNPIQTLPETHELTLVLSETRREEMTELFWKEPSISTWLDATLGGTAGDTAPSVLSESGMLIGNRLYAGLETWRVTGTGPLAVTRGEWDSQIRKHWSWDEAGTRRVEVTDHPRNFTGRRVWLYAYGEGDDLTGDGTLFWSGRISREPELQEDGTHWHLQIGNSARIFGQTLGEGLENPVGLRGITYHPDARLRVGIFEAPTAVHFEYDDFVLFEIGGDAAVHYETLDEFLSAFNDAAATALAAGTFNSSPEVVAVAEPDGRWGIRVKVDTTTTRYITVRASSIVDGMASERFPLVDPITGDEVGTVTGGETYKVQWGAGVAEPILGARKTPRGVVGAAEGVLASDSLRTLHLAGDADVTNIGAVRIEWPAVGDLPESVLIHRVDASDATERTVTIDLNGISLRPFTADLMPSVKPIKVYVESGHLGDLVQALVDEAVTELNRAGAPLIDTTDVDTAGWDSAVVSAARGRPVAVNRYFSQGGEIELGELLKNELRLLALWLGFDSQGRIVPIEMRVYTVTDPDAVTVTMLRRPRPKARKMDLGTLKGALAKTGYQAGADEWLGTNIILKDVVATSRAPLGAMWEIEPRSREGSGLSDTAPLDDTRWDEVEDLVSPAVGLFGSPYAVYRFDAPLSALDVLLGDGVKFTPDGRGLPNPDGTRAASEHVGMVVGRRIDLQRGRVSLVVMESILPIAGYAPEFGITAQTNTSGNTWDLTVRVGDPISVEDWGNAGETAETFVSAGDTIRILQWGVASPTSVTGTIDSVSGNAMTVTLGSTWTPSTNKWTVRPRAWSQATESQQRYAHWAGADGVIGTDTPARVGAP